MTEVLPETEKWGIDAVPALVATEQALGWTPDPLLRLAAIVPPDAARLAKLAERLRLSKAEAAYCRIGRMRPVSRMMCLKRPWIACFTAMMHLALAPG